MMTAEIVRPDFTQHNVPAGSLARHPVFGVCPVIEANGLYRLVEVVEDGDDRNWFWRRIERVPVMDLELIPTADWLST